MDPGSDTSPDSAPSIVDSLDDTLSSSNSVYCPSNNQWLRPFSAPQTMVTRPLNARLTVSMITVKTIEVITMMTAESRSRGNAGYAIPPISLPQDLPMQPNTSPPPHLPVGVERPESLLMAPEIVTSFPNHVFKSGKWRGILSFHGPRKPPYDS